MKTLAEQVAESNQWDHDYACGYLDGLTAADHNVREHGELLSVHDSYAEGYRRGLVAPVSAQKACNT